MTVGQLYERIAQLEKRLELQGLGNDRVDLKSKVSKMYRNLMASNVEPVISGASVSSNNTNDYSRHG